MAISTRREPAVESNASTALAPLQTSNSVVVAKRPTDGRPRGRIEFLDGLRGLAALTVAVQHGAEQLWPSYLRWSETVFRPGEFGVILFFIISGFIIPASLERYGSLSRFWISRFFRLFPMYWATLLAVAFFAFVTGTFQLTPAARANPLTAFGINATMLTDFVKPPPILGQSWSLAYELSFYGMVSMFFVCGVHRRSVRLAIGWIVAAVVIGGVAPILGMLYRHGVTFPHPVSDLTTLTAVPAGLFSQVTPGRILFAVAVVMALTTAAIVVIGLSLKRALLVLVIAAFFVPLLLNRPEPFYFAALLFMAMFSGTVLFRYVRGTISGRVSLAIYAVAMAVTALVLRAQIGPHDVMGGVASWHTEAFTFLGAYVVFGIGVLLRGLRVPRSLLWLGAISYSLYLVHVVVYYDTPWWAGNRVLTLARWLALSLVVSSITYLAIERPFQHWGHTLAKRGLRVDRRTTVDARLG